MAEPTLSDVLQAIAALDGKVGALDGKVGALDGKVGALDTKVDGNRAELNARFDRVDKQLAEIDRDLTEHMNVHRELEKDVEALKRRPPRAAARARRPRSR